MGYVASNLLPGEQIVYQARIHWFVFVNGIVLMLLSLVLFVLQVSAESGHYGYLLGGAALLVAAVYSLVTAAVTRASTELAVTSKRVIAKTGLVMRHTVELNHSKVESFNVDQGIFGRIFDFGTVVVNGTGGVKTPIPNIESPLRFRRGAMETIDESQAGPETRSSENSH